MARRRKQSLVPVEGGERCAMCGEVVPVGVDGRCGLGHRVRPPSGESGASPDISGDITEDLSTGERAASARADDVSAGARDDVTADLGLLAGAAAAVSTTATGDLGDTDAEEPRVDWDLDTDVAGDAGEAAAPERDIAPDGEDDDEDDGDDLGGALDW